MKKFYRTSNKEGIPPKIGYVLRCDYAPIAKGKKYVICNRVIEGVHGNVPTFSMHNVNRYGHYSRAFIFDTAFLAKAMRQKGETVYCVQQVAYGRYMLAGKLVGD